MINYYDAFAAVLRIFASLLAAVVSSMLPVPETLRYMTSNAISQVIEKLIKWLETNNVPEDTRAILVISADRGMAIHASESNIANVLSEEFRAVCSLLRNQNAVMKTQNFKSVSGNTFSIPFACQPQVVKLQECEFTLSVSILLAGGDSEKQFGRIDTLRNVKSVLALLTFDKGEQNRCIALKRNPDAVLQAALAHIVALFRTTLAGNSVSDRATASEAEILARPGIAVRKLSGTRMFSYNYLYDDVLVAISEISDKVRVEGARVSMNFDLVAFEPREPVVLKTDDYGIITFLAISETNEQAMELRGKNASPETYIYVTSSEGRIKTAKYLDNISKQKKVQKIWDIPRITIYSLLAVPDEETKKWWSKKERPLTRTLQNSFFTDAVREQVFGRIDMIKEKRLLYEKAGVATKVGFVLEGPPGTGKSTLALVIAHELGNVPVVNFSFAGISTAVDFRNAVDDLARHLPSFDVQCVIAMDDIEKSAFFRAFAEQVDSAAAEKKDSPPSCDLAVFLNWMDGLESGSSRILIVSVNDMTLIKKVDEISKGSLLRPGRLNYTVRVDCCDRSQFVGFYEHVFDSKYDSAFDKFGAFTIADLQALLIDSDFSPQVFLALCEKKAAATLDAEFTNIIKKKEE